MRKKIVIATVVSLIALALQACSTVNCGANGDDRNASGGCRAHTTF